MSTSKELPAVKPFTTRQHVAVRSSSVEASVQDWDFGHISYSLVYDPDLDTVHIEVSASLALWEKPISPYMTPNRPQIKRFSSSFSNIHDVEPKLRSKINGRRSQTVMEFAMDPNTLIPPYINSIPDMPQGRMLSSTSSSRRVPARSSSEGCFVKASWGPYSLSCKQKGDTDTASITSLFGPTFFEEMENGEAACKRQGSVLENAVPKKRSLPRIPIVRPTPIEEEVQQENSLSTPPPPIRKDDRTDSSEEEWSMPTTPIDKKVYNNKWDERSVFDNASKSDAEIWSERADFHRFQSSPKQKEKEAIAVEPHRRGDLERVITAWTKVGDSYQITWEPKHAIIVESPNEEKDKAYFKSATEGKEASSLMTSIRVAGPRPDTLKARSQSDEVISKPPRRGSRRIRSTTDQQPFASRSMGFDRSSFAIAGRLTSDLTLPTVALKRSGYVSRLQSLSPQPLVQELARKATTSCDLCFHCKKFADDLAKIGMYPGVSCDVKKSIPPPPPPNSGDYARIS